MRGKRWGMGRVEEAIVRQIDEHIHGQRELTNYDGPDEGWDSHVGNTLWDIDVYQAIGRGAGSITALLLL